MSTSTIVLISGANRGIGLGLFKHYIALPNHIVIAANRDIYSSSSKALNDLPKGEGSKAILVKVEAVIQDDAFQAVEQLKQQGIERIDIVIANAGISNTFPTVAKLKISDLDAHIRVNVYGVVWLYQATLPLLHKSSNPKFINVGSLAGSFEASPNWPNSAYGTSKAAIHWLTRRIHFEEPNIVAFVISPGLTQTDMGNAGARLFGLDEAPVTVEDCVNGMVDAIDKSTKETHSGRLVSYTSEFSPW
ncbi:uncharacterized protein L201_005876 [Kwoniella dendrophila CBS 6074]|uniref:NAD(P)-binding protein n=1 Tax=Kwoniella dendrophila CBS 6074 TaxID=1295534 RepID=A0AAX4K1C1_9TREE